MADIAVLCAKAAQAIEDLSERTSAKQWSDFSRTSFVYSATQTINALEDVANLILEIDKEATKEGFEDKAQIKEHLKEMNALIIVLHRNKDLEATRLEKTREKGIELLAENVVAPDLYSSLEQKVLGLTLKSRYLLERVNIHLRKHESKPFIGSKSTKDVLDLLSEKETELQRLKQKHEELQNTGVIARLAEDTPADIEHELNSFSRKLSTETKLLSDAFELNKKKLVEMELSQKQIEARMNMFEHVSQKHFEKALELITLLKKERDYSKKLVLDIEGETLSLRNTYSRKLLGLEEEKTRIKSEAFENFRKTLSKQENDLTDKTELIKSLRETVQNREQKIKKLEEQLKQKKEKKQSKK